MLFGPFHLLCNHWLTIYGKAAWGVLIKNSQWSLLCLLLSRFQRWLWDAGTSSNSPRDLDVNMASIALSLAIPVAESIPRHSSPPSKSGLNSAPPVGSWCTYGFVTLAKSQFQHIPWNIKKRWIWWICRPCLMQFKNYTKESNDWEFTSENKSSRTTWKRSLRSPRFLGRTVSLSNWSLQSPSAGPYTSFVSTMHQSCIHNFEGYEGAKIEVISSWPVLGVPSSWTKKRDLGCLHSIAKLHFTFILFVIKAYKLYQLAGHHMWPSIKSHVQKSLQHSSTGYEL